MSSLEHGMPKVYDMPRFDDGIADIWDPVRVMAESIVNEIMDAQAEDVCADCNQRNGYRERSLMTSLMTSVGAIRPCIPKLRCGSYFPEGLIVRYSRVDRVAIAAISPRWWPWAFPRGR